MSPDLKKCKIKSSKFHHNQIKYLKRRPLVDRFNETDFSYFITIPLRDQFKSYDVLSSQLSRLIVNLNRKIFTNKELKNNQSLNVLPVIQKDNHYHILIDEPDCKRLNELDEEERFDFIKDKLFKIIEKMYLSSKRLLLMRDKNAKLKSFQKLENIDDRFQVINYMTRDDELMTKIDYVNVNLAT